MDIFSKFATDPKKEVEGVVQPIGNGTYLTVARYTNDKALALMAALRERHAVALNSADPEVVTATNREIQIDAMANHVLIDWTGIEFKGKQLKYTVENAKLLLKLNDFRDLVFKLSYNADQYRYDEVTAAEKNS